MSMMMIKQIMMLMMLTLVVLCKGLPEGCTMKPLPAAL